MRSTTASRTASTSDPGLGADQEGVLAPEPDDVLHLLQGRLDVGRGQVDLVDDRDEDQVVLDGEVGVGQGLGLDALGGVDDQQAPSQAARLRETS